MFANYQNNFSSFQQMASALGGQGKGQGGDNQQPEKRKKESILDLTKFLEKPVRVKFAGKNI